MRVAHPTFTAALQYVVSLLNPSGGEGNSTDDVPALTVAPELVGRKSETPSDAWIAANRGIVVNRPELTFTVASALSNDRHNYAVVNSILNADIRRKALRFSVHLLNDECVVR